jgi:hypothetical protein
MLNIPTDSGLVLGYSMYVGRQMNWSGESYTKRLAQHKNTVQKEEKLREKLLQMKANGNDVHTYMSGT